MKMYHFYYINDGEWYIYFFNCPLCNMWKALYRGWRGHHSRVEYEEGRDGRDKWGCHSNPGPSISSNGAHELSERSRALGTSMMNC